MEIMRENVKIGVVLAGGMSKGAYEIGCLRAIGEYFAPESIVAVTAASIGVPIGYAFVADKLDQVTELWKGINVEDTGRFFPNLSGNKGMLETLRGLVGEKDPLFTDFYATLWNFSDRKAEYVQVAPLSDDERRDHLTASICLPVFGKGFKMNGKTYYDGAFLDNIPVYPFLEKDVDYIFCIYFDKQDYQFESEEFDAKCIKLYDFPIKHRWRDNYIVDPNSVDEFVQFGYDYTKRMIETVFEGKESHEEILEGIAQFRTQAPKKRSTSDTILTNVNRLTSRLMKKNIR